MASGWPPKRAVAFDFEIVIRDADGDPIVDPAGLSAVASKDGAAQSAITAPAVVNVGSKIVKVALNTVEATADRIAIVVSSTSTGAKDAFALIFTDTSQIRDQATSSALSAVQTDTNNIQTRIPAALVGGRIDSDVGAKTGNVALSAQEKLDVNAEADTALTDYDGPTNAEMIARTLTAPAYFDPAADTVANVANLANLPAIPPNWITPGGIAASAMNGKGDWNIGKTGYSISGAKTTLDALNDITSDSVITQVSGTADSGTTTTLVDAVRPEADTDYWKGSFILITSGNIAGQIRRITSFIPATGTITVDTAFTQAVVTNTYIILRVGYGEAAAAGSGDWSNAEKENFRSALGITGTKTTATGGQLQALDTVTDGIQTDLSNATDGLGALKTGIDAIPTTPMRGTDSVPLNPALDTVYTAARAVKIDEITPVRLSELDAATSGKMANQVDLVKTEADKIALVDAGAGVAGSVIEEVENRPTNANTTVPPTVSAIRTEMDSNSSKLAEVTAARLSELDNVAGKLVAIVDLIKIEVDKLDAVRGEPGQGAPPVNASSLLKQDYVYKNFRNRKAQTSTEFKLYADNATTVDQKSTVSDDGTTGEKGEMTSGP